MGDTAVKAQSTLPPEMEAFKWQPGKSGNPGGRSKDIRALQATIALAHGPKILTALQELFRIGTDLNEPGKVRVAALSAFVDKTGALSGLGAVAKAPLAEASPENEGELIARVTDRLLEKQETRDMVAAKLSVLQGGKP